MPSKTKVPPFKAGDAVEFEVKPTRANNAIKPFKVTGIVKECKAVKKGGTKGGTRMCVRIEVKKSTKYAKDFGKTMTGWVGADAVTLKA